MTLPIVAGVELGGTKCICIIGRSPDEVIEEVCFETKGPQSTLPEIQRVLNQWHSEHGFAALGIASFGPLDLEKGNIARTPKPGWSGVKLVCLFDSWGVPIRLDTDVNGAAFAEGRWGAAAGLSDFAYITVGTGIGVGSIVNGAPVRGLGHSEAGHLRIPRISADYGPGCCPFHHDCVEGLASGPAIEGHGDMAIAAHALGMLLHNLALTTAPERIIIGGGVAIGNPELLAAARDVMVDSLARFGPADAIAANSHFICPPALGTRAGPLGALALALAALGS